MFFDKKKSQSSDQKVYVQGKFKGEFWAKSTVQLGTVNKEQLSNVIVNSGEITDVVKTTATNHLTSNASFNDVLGFFNTVGIVSSTGLPHLKYTSIYLRDVRFRNTKITLLSERNGKQTGRLECEVSGYIFNYDLAYQAQQNHFYHPGKTTIKKEVPKQSWPKEKASTAQRNFQVGNIFLWILIAAVFLFGISTSNFLFILIALFAAGRNLFAIVYKNIFAKGKKVISLILPKVAAVAFSIALIGVWGYVRSHKTSRQQEEYKYEDEQVTAVTYDDLLKDTVITHHRVWENYQKQKFEGDIKILKSDYIHTKISRLSSPQPTYNGHFWAKVYSELQILDSAKIKQLVNQFVDLQINKQLSDKETIEAIGCFIQDIQYALIVQQACNPNLYRDDENFMRVYNDCPTCCAGNVLYGVHSPVEFLTTLKGDCDTRTVLAHLILKKLGYDAVILNSKLYQHSMLGIALPQQLGSFKRIQGKKYYFWELTAKNYQPGFLSQHNGNVNAWDLELK